MTLERTLEIEQGTQHDIMAVVKAISASRVGRCGGVACGVRMRPLHFLATLRRTACWCSQLAPNLRALDAVYSHPHLPLTATTRSHTPSAAEKCEPEFGGFVHFGATSQDINDTVSALQLQECKVTLLGAMRDVRAELTRLAERYGALPAIGRTHGQHAIPITMGFKFANYLYELTVAESFLERVVIVGKFSGAVGTFASLGTSVVQASIMRQLGITAAPISTQARWGSLRGAPVARAPKACESTRASFPFSPQPTAGCVSLALR